MSDVAAVSFDETTKTALHVWTARGVKSLNRKNKLSSRTFTSPETTTPFGQFAFRLILLRGVVKASDAANDPVSLFVELQGDVYPSRLRIEVVAKDVEGKELKREETHTTFDESNRAADFKTFIGGEQFNALGDDALNFECTIQYEQSLTSGLWASATGVSKSFWGGATKALSSVAESGASLFSHRAVMEGRTEEAGPNDATGPSPPSCPWATVPPKWEGREDKWEFLLTQYLPQNEATFLRGPREFTSSEELLLTQSGLSMKACTRAADLFDADRDIHEQLIATGSHTLRGMRFELVPAKVTEDAFWHNYFWRVECLKLCANEEQSKVILSILNAPIDAAGCGSDPDGAAAGDEGDASPEATEAAGVADVEAEAEATLIANCRDARVVCEELLADELSDVDIVQAAGHSLRQALLNMGDLDAAEAAASRDVLSQLDTAVTQAEASPSTPAAPAPSSAPVAEVVEEEEEEAVSTPAKDTNAAPTASKDGEEAAAAASDADEIATEVTSEPAAAASPTSDVGEVDLPSSNASPAAAAKPDAVDASPAARGSAGSAVLMPWEEEDD